MNFFDRILKRSSSAQGNAPKFIKKYTDRGATYEIYKGSDPETAKEFLGKKTVTQGMYYILVETADGNWGKDKDGIYLEHLQSWQNDLSSIDAEGQFIPMTWSDQGLKYAAKGINDNFIVKLECGKCKHQWIDGVRYNNDTLVKCPQCKAKNKIDSRNIHIVFV
jgi:predicted Zn-ribbon and HTH transcriptional regulator